MDNIVRLHQTAKANGKRKCGWLECISNMGGFRILEKYKIHCYTFALS